MYCSESKPLFSTASSAWNSCTSLSERSHSHTNVPTVAQPRMVRLVRDDLRDVLRLRSQFVDIDAIEEGEGGTLHVEAVNTDFARL